METVGIFFGKIIHRDATDKVDGMDMIFAPARRNAEGKLKTNHATNDRIKKLETGYFPVAEAMSDDLWCWGLRVTSCRGFGTGCS